MSKAWFRVLTVIAVLTVMAVAPSAANAEEGPLFGVRFGYYTNADAPFAGAEFLFRVARPVYFNPNAEYVFVDGTTYMTFNADFHYDFYTHRRAFIWVGAGLGLAYSNPEGSPPSDTDAAFNALFGVGVRHGSVIPYFQFKLVAKDDTEAVFGFGLRF